jgi:hypothetical protein
MDYDDLNEHPFAVFMRGERVETESDIAWDRWVKKVEKFLGHSLDGNEEEDGYSLDFAHDAFTNGESAEDFAEEIVEAVAKRREA